MYADYEREGLTLQAVADRYGRKCSASIIYLFKSRGYKTRPLTEAQVIGGRSRRARLDPLAAQLYADYQKPMSFAALSRLYKIERRSIRDLFEIRGFEIRAANPKQRHAPGGRFASYIPLTDEQLKTLIDNATSLSVPVELKLEWRHWSLERRGDFIRRMRARLDRLDDQPQTPFSANVRPFDYATAEAHAIVARMNVGTDSRSARVKINICSQGVIWRDQLWFWSPKVGYQCGPWTPQHGRPSLHKTIWEEANGRKVPAGHVLRFIDGNPNNLTAENLRLLSRNDVARENQAKSLLNRARATTALLLNRQQNQDHENTSRVAQLRGR